MKRRFIAIMMLMLFSVASFAFGGCIERRDDAPDGGITYTLTVQGNTSELMEGLRDKYPAGAEIEVKCYPVTDVDTYVFLDGEQVTQTHFDSDYWGYTFTMPEKDATLFITHNRFTVVTTCSFDSVFRWARTLDRGSIAQVCCERGFVAVADPTPEITYSSDREDIGAVCAIFDKELTYDGTEPIDGGNYIKYTLYDENSDVLAEFFVFSGRICYTSFSECCYFVIPDFVFPDLKADFEV